MVSLIVLSTTRAKAFGGAKQDLRDIEASDSLPFQSSHHLVV
jgi:hypothetical protein